MTGPAVGLGVAAARRAIFAAARRMRTGELTVGLPGGGEVRFGDPGSGPRARIDVHDDAFFTRLALRGEIGLGEAYMDGLWSSPDLPGLLGLGARNRRSLALTAGWWRRPSQWADRRLHLRRRNTARQSRHNIAAHYDLSNEFFALWLDETMTYSSAVFEEPGQALASAQRAKFQRLADAAGVSAGSRVLEIGCGWGGFAIETARKRGCHITAITISAAQLALATQRAEAAGLAGQVDLRLEDYRAVRGTFDAIVSIEMLEAVGAEYLNTFFRVCDRRLRPGGRAAIQVITVPERDYARSRDGVNWLQKYIFPGGVLPSLAAIEAALAGTSLVITDVKDIGLHYAETLRRWREAFFARLDAVRALGFDDRFVRTWDYYLALCEAGFSTRFTQDLQITLEKTGP
jgi:cyclopropane-fatty-acyl-phospholipid synthase